MGKKSFGEHKRSKFNGLKFLMKMNCYKGSIAMIIIGNID